MPSAHPGHEMMSAQSARALCADLRRQVRGAVLVDDETLAKCSVDYGGMTTRRPSTVVKPESTADVAEVLQYATSRSVRVVARGAGHSQGGQPLCDGGIVVDMSALQGTERISTVEEWGQARAGTKWAAFTNDALAHGMRPPVLTDNLATTLGGTHAAGGFGTASLRHGAQVNHCLAVELVTGAGDVLWCTRNEHRAELACALGGLGQLGIVTRVRHRLRRCPAFARTHVLNYVDIDVMLDDFAQLRTQSGIDGAGISVHYSRGRWVGALVMTEETDDAAVDGLLAATTDLRPARRVPGRPQSRAQFTSGGAMERDHRTYAPGTVRPCLDVLLPASAVGHYCTLLLQSLRGTMRDRAQVVLLPVARMPAGPALLALPPRESIVLVGVYSEIPNAEAGAAVHALRELLKIAMRLDGTLYPIGSIPLDRDAWRTHLGDAWTAWAALKRHHDPANVLAGGFTA